MNRFVYYLAILMLCLSCTSDADKHQKILAADELEIQCNTYGGFAGYYETYYYLKNDAIVITSKGDPGREIVVQMNEEKRALLKQFLALAYATNDPKKSMSNSCVTGIDHEYLLETKSAKLTLRPSQACDSVFNLMAYGR